MTRPTLILSVLVVSALCFGLTRSLSVSVNEDLSARDTSRAVRGTVPIHKGSADPMGQLSVTRASVSETHRGAVTAQGKGGSGPPLVIQIEFENSSIDLGEPRDADDGQAVASIAAQEHSVAIGAELNADDPYPVEPTAIARLPMQIGQSLHADDRHWSRLPMVSQDPIAIGRELDASDPWGWALRAVPNPPVEIGLPLGSL